MEEYKPENNEKENATINLNPRDYSSTTTNEKPVQSEQSKMVSANYAKVFLWFGIGLLITGLISFGLPNIFYFANSGNIDSYITAYYIMIAVACIGIFPLSIMMSVSTAMRNNKTFVKVTYILYTIFMGILMSGIMLTVLAFEEVADIKALSTIAYAFLITASLFMIMGLIGIKVKNMSKVLPILLTFLLGAVILSIVNLILKVDWIYWIIDFILFAWILIITAVDMNNLNKIAQRVNFKEESNLAIYLAYSLYIDFIYIFIRVIYLLLLVSGSRKK